MAGARPLSHAESDAVLAKLERHRDRLLVLAGQHLGLRISELLSLRVKQVADAGVPKNAVTVKRSALKGGKSGRRGVSGRTIPLHPDLASEIALYLSACLGMPDPEAFLFQSREGNNQPLSYVQAWRVLKNAAKACGLDTARISTHSLRKGFAKEVFEASGHSLPVTQKALGHKSILTTIAYLDTDQNEVDEVIRGIASRARPAEAPGGGIASSA